LAEATESLLARVRALKELEARMKESQNTYAAYEKQKEFHEIGIEYAERCLMAGNQTGKTYSGAMECYFHLSGNYPEWWRGLKFEKAPVIWVGGDTGETIRDTTQRLLLDRPGKLQEDSYEGILPKRIIIGDPKPALGTPNLFDHVKVRHTTGAISYCYFKAYAKGRQKWQGETIDLVWFDEEPPEELYAEGLTRTNRGQLGQRAVLTFTPLLGMSNVVAKFLQSPSPAQKVVKMTIEDVGHYTEAERTSIVASYLEHEREARAKGIPIMGSGRVFPITEASIIEEPLQMKDLPGWWKSIAGIDFGWQHPSAAVMILYDPENDIVHIHATHREKNATPIMFAGGVRTWGEAIPFSWPHDGLQHDKGSGKTLAEQYKEAGINMLNQRATFDDGSYGLEAGLMDMLDRMQTGRLKVSRMLADWWEEFRIYHRRNGIVVKERDDLMAATRYGIMMLRYAKPIVEPMKRYPTTPKIIADIEVGY
jgi:phage terminase large subunit-like protein